MKLALIYRWYFRRYLSDNPENIYFVIISILMQLCNNATWGNYSSPYASVFFVVQSSSRRIHVQTYLSVWNSAYPEAISTAARNWGICTDGLLIAWVISSNEFYCFFSSSLCPHSPCPAWVLQFSASSSPSTLLRPLSTVASFNTPNDILTLPTAMHRSLVNRINVTPAFLVLDNSIDFSERQITVLQVERKKRVPFFNKSKKD